MEFTFYVGVQYHLPYLQKGRLREYHLKCNSIKKSLVLHGEYDILLLITKNHKIFRPFKVNTPIQNERIPSHTMDSK